MSAILQTSSFIETEGCSGPNYIRNQKSRESPGILMSEIQDKYIPEFELPYRNVRRYIKEVENDWNKLDTNQRLSIIDSFKFMNLPVSTNGIGGTNGIGKGRMENFSPEQSSEPSSNDPIDDINFNISFLKYLSSNTNGSNGTNGTKKFMDMLWNPTDQQVELMRDAGLTKQQIQNIKDSIQQWSADNSFILHKNWRSGSVLLVFLIIIFSLAMVAAFFGAKCTKN